MRYDSRMRPDGVGRISFPKDLRVRFSAPAGHVMRCNISMVRKRKVILPEPLLLSESQGVAACTGVVPHEAHSFLVTDTN